MRTIVWSAVVATGFGAATVAVALLGGSHELVTGLGLAGLIAAMLNLNNR